ncbi:noelin-3-like [Haliotis cracherodii]|uniref:noelin-3-like n=1 Tax=Haliotis cracherodii TaxID=6455 RepID=UPI0039E85794
MGHLSACLWVIVSLCAVDFSQAKPIKNDKCEYDLDLVENNIRVVCQGKGAKVNIYATNAELKEAGMLPSKKDRRPMRPQRDSEHTRAHMYYFRDASPMSDTIRNSTKKMERIKRKLSRVSSSMTNISHHLASGDEKLQSDLDAMRRMQYQSVTLKDTMLAAIQNQYTFMRTAILSHSAEMSKMMDSLQLMIDVTSKSLQSAARSEVDLYLQLGFVNQTMLTMRRMLSRELKKKRRRPNINKEELGTCPQQIVAIGAGDVINVKGKRGAFMKDVADDTGTIFIMAGSGSSDRLVEYESEIDLQYSFTSITFDLPFKCQGTGHVIYRGCLYCQREGTSKIIKYKLDRMENMGEIDVTKTGMENQYAFEFGDINDIDLAVDEYGLWAIYNTPETAGKIMISRINDASMEIEQTWLTSYPRSLASNTFMICGVLYTVESFNETPNYIKYIFDTATAKDTVLKGGSLVFPALDDADVHVSMLDYNFKDGILYAWGGGKVYSFHVFLEDGSRIP